MALLAAALAASCAAVSGSDQLSIADCPAASAACSDDGGVTDDDATRGALPPADAGAPDTQVGPPACDTTTDPSCVPLPVGWTLVAMAPVADAGAPSCPTGLATASDVGEAPSPRSDTCECAGCAVTQAASCAGAIVTSFSFLPGTCSIITANLSNSPAGTCLTDLFTGARDGTSVKLTLPAASAGACSAAPATLHGDRADFATRSRVCDETGRCSGGVCDARVPAPFVACIASPASAVDDDRACPSGYPTKHLVGTGASFSCGATCTCNVNKSCTGSVTYYSDGACATNPLSVPADGTCRSPAFAGACLSYKATTTPATSCTAAGASTAKNGRVTPARTICCR